MLQFYFLSIILNAFSGAALTLGESHRSPALQALALFLKDVTARLVIGIFTMAVGFFKLLSAIRGDIPVLGDLFPAAAGLAAGFALLFEYFEAQSRIPAATHARLEKIFVRNRRWIGYGALCAAGLHFLFPTVVLL